MAKGSPRGPALGRLPTPLPQPLAEVQGCQPARLLNKLSEARVFLRGGPSRRRRGRPSRAPPPPRQAPCPVRGRDASRAVGWGLLPAKGQLEEAEAGGVPPGGRTLAAEAGPGAEGPSSRGRAGWRSSGFIFPEADLGGGKGLGGRGRTPKAPPPEAGLSGLGGRCRVSAVWLLNRTGSGSSQWPAGAEAGGGGSVRAAGLLSRGAGARARRLLLDSAPRSRLAPLRALLLLKPGLLLKPQPAASTPRALSRPVSDCGHRCRGPGPGPDGSVQRRLQGQFFGAGLPAPPPPGVGEASGPGNHHSTPLPPAVCAALRPGQLRVGESPVGACGKLSPRERQVLC